MEIITVGNIRRTTKVVGSQVQSLLGVNFLLNLFLSNIIPAVLHVSKGNLEWTLTSTVRRCRHIVTQDLPAHFGCTPEVFQLCLSTFLATKSQTFVNSTIFYTQTKRGNMQLILLIRKEMFPFDFVKVVKLMMPVWTYVIYHGWTLW